MTAESYRAIEAANSKFVKSGARDNSHNSSNDEQLLKNFESDVLQFLSLWHCGTLVRCAIRSRL